MPSNWITIEAVIYGIRAIAVSNEAWEPKDFDGCICGLERAMRLMQEHKELMLLNVNAPDGPRENCKGIKLTPLGFHKYPTEYDRTEADGETLYYSKKGILYSSAQDDDVDDRWVQKDYITITPLQLNFTDEHMLTKLKEGWHE